MSGPGSGADRAMPAWSLFDGTAGVTLRLDPKSIRRASRARGAAAEGKGRQAMRSKALFVLLLGAFLAVAGAEARGQDEVPLQATAAFLEAMDQSYRGDPPPLTHSNIVWEIDLQYKLFNILEPNDDHERSKRLDKVDHINAYTLLTAYDEHVKNSAGVGVPPSPAIISEVGEYLNKIRREVTRTRAYDDQLDKSSDIDVIRKARDLTNQSRITVADVNNTPRPVVTTRDFTDLVDTTEAWYRATIRTNDQNRNQSRRNYDMKEGRRLLLFENINNQLQNRIGRGDLQPPVGGRFNVQDAFNNVSLPRERDFMAVEEADRD